VVGFTNLEQCVELYNSVLRQLGLPEFTDPEVPYLAPFQAQRSDSVLLERAVITRVDLCRNWSAGSAAAARGVVAALSSVVRLGRCGWLAPDGNTVAWGVGSRFTYVKYYLKGPELRRHAQGDEYIGQLAEWCDSVGLVRQELSCKSMYLKRHGLDRIGAWSMDTMKRHLEGYSPHQEAGASCASFQELHAQLVEEGIPVSRARAAQTALYAYLAGHRFVVGENISKSAYYRLRADVLRAGVDIGAPLNVATLPVRVRELELSPAAAPAWYRWTG
jgi:hypothetical protein